MKFGFLFFVTTFISGVFPCTIGLIKNIVGFNKVNPPNFQFQKGSTCNLDANKCIAQHKDAMIESNNSVMTGRRGEALVKCILETTLLGTPLNDENQSQIKHDLKISSYSKKFTHISDESITINFPEGDTSRIVDFQVSHINGEIGFEVKNIKHFNNDYLEQIAKDYLLLKTGALSGYVWFFIKRNNVNEDTYVRFADFLSNFLDGEVKPKSKSKSKPAPASGPTSMQIDETDQKEDRSLYFTFILVKQITDNQIQLEILR